MILVAPEAARTARIDAGGYRTANRRIFSLVAIGTMFISGCSKQDSVPPVELPPEQPVSSADINRMLSQGDVASQQLAAQLVRLSPQYGGQLNMELNLADTNLTDAELNSITLPDSLTRVDLTRTKITDDGLAHLVSGRNIVEVTLTNTRITSNGLDHLRAMPNLQKVNLHDTDVPAMEQLELLRFLKDRPQE